MTCQVKFGVIERT